MERIKQAVDRVKESSSATRLRPMAGPEAANVSPQSATEEIDTISSQAGPALRLNEVSLNLELLEQNRILAHNAADPRTKSFDMLRTQVLQSMDQKNWKFIAVTSPTPGCGKTVTSINLAFSIARQPQRSALLVDLDLQRPAVAKYLGLKCQHGLKGILEERTPLADAMVRVHADNCELLVLPTEASSVRSSELIGSRAMNVMLQDLRKAFTSRTVIFDMPPLLQGDEVLAILPRIDCVLLVTAAGISTQQQIIECNKHLQSAEVVRLVLNKAAEPTQPYYY